MKGIEADPDLELQIIATGMHLSSEFGFTFRQIEKDGFTISEKVEMLLASDTASGIAKSMGIGTMGLADAFERLRPDLIILLGDRFETLSAAQAALVARIPVAHIAGGDTTEGAFDESIRHSITKMSHLHFVTNEAAYRRVRQMGEDPACIFNVGSPGIDCIKRTPRLERRNLEQELSFRFRTRNFLITFHPATLDPKAPPDQFKNLLEALSSLGPQFGLIFTRTNADNDGRILNTILDEFVAAHDNARAYSSLGQQVYLSTIAQVDAVVGNSSSGLYEVPSFRKPTVNIGDRQRGRLQASSVITCKPDTADIIEALQQALVLDCSNTINPYGDGNSADRIISVLKTTADPCSLLQKKFHDFS